MSNEINVTSEIAQLRRVLIHSPDGGIGKIIPDKFKEWLYDDTVHLEAMQMEYDEFVRILLYFLDKPTAQGLPPIQALERGRSNAFKPGKEGYFNSDKVIDIQKVLKDLLAKEIGGKENIPRRELIASICALEGCSYEIQMRLNDLDAEKLTNALITGVIPRGEDEGKNSEKFVFPPIPNLVFTRDIGIVINGYLLLSKTAKKARKRESILVRFVALNHFFEGELHRIIDVSEHSEFFLKDKKDQKKEAITIEGGDVMMIAKDHLLVGCSERTSPNGVNRIINELFIKKIEVGVRKISVIKIPPQRSSMHIDTIFTQVKSNLWVMFGQLSEVHKAEADILSSEISFLDRLAHKKHSESSIPVEIIQFHIDKEAVGAGRRFILETESDYESLESVHYSKPKGLEGLLRQVSTVDFLVPPEKVEVIYSGEGEFPYDEREQWTDSCNLLTIKEGIAIGYYRNQRTADAFKDKGFDVKTAAELLMEFESGVDPNSLKDTLILLSSAELSRARGGSHCMSMPLLRNTY